MKHVDLFSGIGGFSLGFERAGIETVAFCEKNEYCQGVLEKHFPGVPLCSEIEEFPTWWKTQKKVGENYVVTAGFPCQPFSIAGRQKGVEDDRWLWPETAQAVRAVRQEFVALENVAALITHSDAFGQVLGDLYGLGYDAQWRVVSARELGGLHYRKRVIIISYPNGLDSRWGNKLVKSPERYHNFFSSGIPSPNGFKRWAYETEWRESEPIVRRVVNGVPLGLVSDRLRGLGNAIVPQVAEYLARWILSFKEKEVHYVSGDC